MSTNQADVAGRETRVYMMGAGASYPALPLARGVSRAMIDWSGKLRDYANRMPDGEQKAQLAEMSRELDIWGTTASLHYSIDTLAKKLYLTSKHADLWHLKAAMSAFFMLQQSAVPVEQRYDSFLAAVLEQPGRPQHCQKTCGYSRGIMIGNSKRPITSIIPNQQLSRKTSPSVQG